jgi:hypothetical protein
MSDKKQTAVEWLFQEINKLTGLTIAHDEPIIEQAKEIEKQQIIEAHGDKQKLKSNPGSIVTYGYNFTGEMYYNQTFKNTENETI